MRRPLAFVLLLLAASCSEGERQSQREDLQTMDVSEAPPPDAAAPPPPPPASRESGPNVGPTAAPGVAFNYRYAFRLAAPRIAQVQEQHARMCEELGINRCRITGMHYRVVNEHDIEGSLSFRLEPTIARRFGQQGIEAVVRAEGMLVESRISGTDVAPTIRAAGKTAAQLGDDLRRIEARLRTRGLSGEERAQLEYEAGQLRRSIRAAQDNREEAEESLATTPMTFQYGSGDLVPGFDNRPPLREAVRKAGDNFVAGVAILFIILVTILPWVLLGLLVWLGSRWALRRWGRRPSAERQAERPAEG